MPRLIAQTLAVTLTIAAGATHAAAQLPTAEALVPEIVSALRPVGIAPASIPPSRTLICP